MQDCLDNIKYNYDQNEKSTIIPNKNVAMFLKKSVSTNLLQMIESSNTYETYTELVDMPPDKSSIVRSVLAEIPNFAAHNMQAYVFEH